MVVANRTTTEQRFLVPISGYIGLHPSTSKRPVSP